MRYKYIELDAEIMPTNGTVVLDDVTIVIPVRIDTEDRYNNLKFVLSYFDSWFSKFELIVVEHDIVQKTKKLVESYGFTHIHRKSKGSFHKTYNLNLGIALSSHNYVAAYDCDAVLQPMALEYAFNRLKNQQTDFIYPYNHYLIDIPRDRIDCPSVDFFDELPFVNYDDYKNDVFSILYGTVKEPTTGGAFFFNKKAFFINGGYNPNIISYGCEDNEIAERLFSLGHKIERLANFNCYHLHHGRSIDSHYNNFFDSNKNEYEKIKFMPSKTLEEYVHNGFKSTLFDSTKRLNITNTHTEYKIEVISDEKYDLSDLDIIIPVYIDFPDRMRNLTAVVNQFEKLYTNYNIILVEMDSSECGHLYHRTGVLYFNMDELFSKTRAINFALGKCQRQYVSVWDVDSLLPIQGMSDAMSAIRTGRNHIAYPYNGWFIDVDNGVRDTLANTFEFSQVPHFPHEKGDIEHISVRKSSRNRKGGGGNNGGCVIFNRVTLNLLGNYNENFYRWGWEDDEIEARFEIMGYTRYNSPNANCYHMVHQRVEEATLGNNEFFIINEREFKRVGNMSKEELQEYIDNNFNMTHQSVSVVVDDTTQPYYIEQYAAYANVKEVVSLKEIEGIRHIKNISACKSMLILKPKFLLSEDEVQNKVIKLFNRTKRTILLDHGKEVLAIRKDFHEVVGDNYEDFNVVNWSDVDGAINSNKPKKVKVNKKHKASIILTTYGGETLSTELYFNRFKWIDLEEYEMIVVVHDETILHSVYLDYLQSHGLISKIVYAAHDHGHVKGLGLGIEHAESEIVLIINNDVHVSQEVVDNTVDRMIDNDKIGVIGWHYNAYPNFDGTFWNKDGSLNCESAPDKDKELRPEEVKKIKAAPWFTGKVFNAIGEKRILLSNGSFMCTRKKLWNKIGGFNPNIFKHYFLDDYFCYGVLDQGYDIENLPKDIRCSQKPEIFDSFTDLDYTGNGNPNKGKDEIHDAEFSDRDKDSLIMSLLNSCGNSGYVRGNGPDTDEKKLTAADDFNFIVLEAPVSSHKIARNLIPEGGYVICKKEFCDDTYQMGENYGYYHKITMREEYTGYDIVKSKKLKGRTRSPNEINKFIMLTQPRVGFNATRHMLLGHPEIFLDNTIFDDVRKVSAVATGLTKGFGENKFSDPEAYLNEYYNMIGIDTDKPVVGFRFMSWNEPKNFVEKCVVNMTDTKKILWTRDNLLKSAVDCAMAQKTNIWHTCSDSIKFPEVELDIQELLGWILNVQNITAWWLECLNSNDVDFLEVEYEKMISGEDLERMYDYLECSNFKEDLIFKQTITPETYKSILNKDEIERELGKFGLLE